MVEGLKSVAKTWPTLSGALMQVTPDLAHPLVNALVKQVQHVISRISENLREERVKNEQENARFALIAERNHRSDQIFANHKHNLEKLRT